MRLGYLAVLAGFSALLAAGSVVPAASAERAGVTQAAPTDISTTDFSAQSQRARPRRATRVRITRQLLPPDAVRECQAWYVQEHRPSGTVITPRMQCWWTR